MGMYLTPRFASHGDGWNGHGCSEPHYNTYCVGTHSYPGEMIALRRDLDIERVDAVCARWRFFLVSARLPGVRALTSFADPPDFFTPFASDGTMYLADFMLLYNGEKYYWEHVGRMHDPVYVQHWHEKKAWYEHHFQDD